MCRVKGSLIIESLIMAEWIKCFCLVTVGQIIPHASFYSAVRMRAKSNNVTCDTLVTCSRENSFFITF